MRTLLQWQNHLQPKFPDRIHCQLNLTLSQVMAVNIEYALRLLFCLCEHTYSGRPVVDLLWMEQRTA